MSPQPHTGPDETRMLFSRAMSEMYRSEVPQYGTLVDLVNDINEQRLNEDPALREALMRNDELDRLAVERHGAIRLGTAEELFNIRRLFAVMGMYPVGYYDLSVAGIPVHSTCFRPLADDALRYNPFRVFTSLLRLDLIADAGLRGEAARILSRRQIFTPRVMELIAAFERDGGLATPQAEEFVREALETFRWHSGATVSLDTYRQLLGAHRLIADVVCFKGPHINHLTPRTLDIDAVQEEMPKRSIAPKAVVEGPPRRKCPILLRQTSFKALEEPIAFSQADGTAAPGTHTARFGEIEQRGVALTARGRKLYDELLASVRHAVQIDGAGSNVADYQGELEERFEAFPDDWETIRARDLAYFRYSASEAGIAAAPLTPASLSSIDELIAHGYLHFDPIVYEDFLPVSAAGIFQSNLGTDEQRNYSEKSNQTAFEAALGKSVYDADGLYAQAQAQSLRQALARLGRRDATVRSSA